jgi:hypothetical protein
MNVDVRRMVLEEGLVEAVMAIVAPFVAVATVVFVFFLVIVFSEDPAKQVPNVLRAHEAVLAVPDVVMIVVVRTSAGLHKLIMIVVVGVQPRDPHQPNLVRRRHVEQLLASRQRKEARPRACALSRRSGSRRPFSLFFLFSLRLRRHDNNRKHAVATTSPPRRISCS